MSKNISKQCKSEGLDSCDRPSNNKLDSNRRFFSPCDLEIWWMTLENNKAPLLYCIKLCASFQIHRWIQTGVTVRKRLSGVMTSMTLTFDLWHWPFAWTAHLPLVIAPENFRMISWWEHSEKGVTDGITDRRTEKTIHSAAWSQLKKMVGDTVSASHVHNDVSNQKKHDVSVWLLLCVRSVTVTQQWALEIKHSAERSCFISSPNHILYLHVCYLG